MKPVPSRSRGLGLAAVASLVAGCGGGATDPPSVSTADPLVCMTAIVNKSCGMNGCHSGVNLSANLLITPDTIKDGKNFINKPAEGGDGNTECVVPGNLRINPTAPEQSLIYKKLDPDVCGSQMPETEPKLTPTEKACVLDWIKSSIAKSGG